MERRLGRGLGSLLGGTTAEAGKNEPRSLPVARIRPNPHQPRRQFAVEELEELASSLRRHGVLQPVLVREAAEGYELIAGERRLRAAKLVGLAEIPAVVRQGVSDGEMLELALIENVQRADLNAIERAQGYQQLQERLGLTQEAVAERVGLRRSTVTNHLRLLELPQRVQDGVARGLLSMGHARALLALATPVEQERCMERVVREDLSVRQVELLSAKLGRKSGSRAPSPATLQPAAAWVPALEKRLQEALGTRVRVRVGPAFHGELVLEFYSREDLDRITGKLLPREELR